MKPKFADSMSCRQGTTYTRTTGSSEIKKFTWNGITWKERIATPHIRLVCVLAFTHVVLTSASGEVKYRHPVDPGSTLHTHTALINTEARSTHPPHSIISPNHDPATTYHNVGAPTATVTDGCAESRILYRRLTIRCHIIPLALFPERLGKMEIRFYYSRPMLLAIMDWSICRVALR